MAKDSKYAKVPFSSHHFRHNGLDLWLELITKHVYIIYPKKNYPPCHPQSIHNTFSLQKNSKRKSQNGPSHRTCRIPRRPHRCQSSLFLVTQYDKAFRDDFPPLVGVVRIQKLIWCLIWYIVYKYCSTKKHHP